MSALLNLGLGKSLGRLALGGLDGKRPPLVTLSSSAIIVVIGNSTIAGQGSQPAAAQAWQSFPSQLADKLAAEGYNASGEGLFCDHGSWGTAQNIANYVAGDNRLTYTGAAALGAGMGPGGNAFEWAAAGATTFSSRSPVSRFEIVWREATGRQFNYQIDGGAAVNVTAVAASQISRVTTAQVALGPHTLTINWVAGSTRFFSVFAYDDTGGKVPLRVYNWGISGANSANLINNSDPTTGRMAGYAFHAPDVAIIEGGIINDWRQSIAVATSKANLTTLVTAAKTWKGGTCKPILMTPVFDNGTAGNTAIQAQYVTAMKEVAVEQNVPFLDVRPTFQNWAYANSQGWMAGSVHLTAAGNTVIAGLVRNAIRVSD